VGTWSLEAWKAKNGSMYGIRSCEQEDAERALTFLRVCFAQSGHLLLRTSEEISNITLEQEKKFINDSKDNPKELMLAAFDCNQVMVACGHLSVGHTFRLRHQGEFGISVLEDHQRLGIARKMLRVFEQHARNNDLEKLQLAVHAVNEKAKNLYKSFGYGVEGTRMKDLKFADGTYSDSVLMAKFL
jgi:ribosomal protein S18 acetylase RimI-like enzyme